MGTSDIDVGDAKWEWVLVGDLDLLLLGVLIMLMGMKVLLSAERRLLLDGEDGVSICWENRDISVVDVNDMEDRLQPLPRRAKQRAKGHMNMSNTYL